MIWRIFGPWRNEKTCEWRKIYNELLNDLYCSPEIFQLIKTRRINLEGHIACWLTGELYTVFCEGKTEGKVQCWRSEYRRAILLKWIFRKWNVGVCPESRRLRVGTSGFCVCVFVCVCVYVNKILTYYACSIITYITFPKVTGLLIIEVS